MKEKHRRGGLKSVFCNNDATVYKMFLCVPGVKGAGQKGRVQGGEHENGTKTVTTTNGLHQ